MLDKSKVLFINGSDLVLFVLLSLLPIVYSRNKKIFSVKKDPVVRWVYIFLGLYWAELLITVILGSESLYNSLKVIRPSFFMCGFFVLRPIPLKCYKSFLKIALSITLAQAVLFFLQFVGYRFLHISKEIDLGSVKFQFINIPPMTVLFLFLSWRFDYLKNKRYLIICFMTAVVLASYIRGTIIAILLGLAYYTFFMNKKRNHIITIIIMMIVVPLAFQAINEKSEERKDINAYEGLEEIQYVYNARYSIDNIGHNDGTFAFRIGMLYERIDWLINHPKYLLTGVGTMHEDSHNTLKKFDFVLGTNNEERYYGQTIIESGDIAWVPIVLRYGLVGTIIHLMIFIVLFRSTWRRRDLLIMLSPMTIYMFVRTFDGAFFESPSELFLLVLYYAMVSGAQLRREAMLL